jgi:hypothetical protein
MRFLALAVFIAACGAAPAAAAGPFGKSPVSEEALASMRGGFALPGGLDVSLAVQSTTSVNGVPLLRTVFTASQGTPVLAVYGAEGGTLSQLPVDPGGAVQTPGGSVRVEGAGSGAEVILTGANLDVRHLAGDAYGAIIANRGNDVSIDTATVIDLRIDNATPLNIGSSMLRIDGIVTEAVGRLVH